MFFQENEQADDLIVPDSNESSKDKASLVEYNCEDDDELESEGLLKSIIFRSIF